MEAEPPAIRRCGAEDLISGLPDEILHIILSRLPSPAAAARTSVLSRRWRGVWVRMPMPKLVFRCSPAPATTPSALLDSIDAALKPPAAPTFRSLSIDVSGVDQRDLPAHRISPWLRFASQRVAGKLSLCLYLRNDAQWWYEDDNMEELSLPIYERATEIDLSCDFYLRTPPTGSFSALTNLNIACDQMDGGELGRIVSSVQCPCLRKLCVIVSRLKPVCDVSICSESPECLHYIARDTGKLEVNAPMLKDIDLFRAAEACIAAPKMENVEWPGPYDPRSHQFAVAGRHLRSLSVFCYSILVSSTRLMERFDTVSELTVSLSLEKGIAGYVTFLKETDKLPICETLVVRLMSNHHGHALAPMMLHLLRRSISIRRFILSLHDQCTPSEMSSCTTLHCPCHLPENCRLDDITFDSLEEIEISFSTGSVEQLEFVELLLSRCNTVILKSVDFMVPSAPFSSEIMEVVQRIRSMCHPNSKVQFIMNC